MIEKMVLQIRKNLKIVSAKI